MLLGFYLMGDYIFSVSYSLITYRLSSSNPSDIFVSFIVKGLSSLPIGRYYDSSIEV